MLYLFQEASSYCISVFSHHPCRDSLCFSPPQTECLQQLVLEQCTTAFSTPTKHSWDYKSHNRDDNLDHVFLYTSFWGVTSLEISGALAGLVSLPRTCLVYSQAVEVHLLLNQDKQGKTICTASTGVSMATWNQVPSIWRHYKKTVFQLIFVMLLEALNDSCHCLHFRRNSNNINQSSHQT